MCIVYYSLTHFQVIADPGSLIGDLLSMDIGGGGAAASAGGAGPVPDLLGGGLDQLLGGGASPAAAADPSGMYFCLGKNKRKGKRKKRKIASKTGKTPKTIFLGYNLKK